MSLSHKYLEFGDAGYAGEDEATLNASLLEEEKLQSFEKGYQAGWEDAVRAHATDQGRIAADFAQNLQELSFTYHEARAKLTGAMQPLFQQLSSKLFPKIAQSTLGAHLVEQLMEMTEQQTEHAIEIAVSPNNIAAVEALLEENASNPFALKSEPSLGDGQVYLRVNSAEREIDLDAVVVGISEALEAFFHETLKESSDG